MYTYFIFSITIYPLYALFQLHSHSVSDSHFVGHSVWLLIDHIFGINLPIFHITAPVSLCRSSDKERKKKEEIRAYQLEFGYGRLQTWLRLASGKRKSGGSLNCKARASVTRMAHRLAGNWFLSISGHNNSLSCLPHSQLQVAARRFPTALGLYPCKLVLHYISLTLN